LQNINLNHSQWFNLGDWRKEMNSCSDSGKNILDFADLFYGLSQRFLVIRGCFIDNNKHKLQAVRIIMYSSFKEDETLTYLYEYQFGFKQLTDKVELAVLTYPDYQSEDGRDRKIFNWKCSQMIIRYNGLTPWLESKNPAYFIKQQSGDDYFALRNTNLQVIAHVCRVHGMILGKGKPSGCSDEAWGKFNERLSAFINATIKDSLR